MRNSINKGIFYKSTKSYENWLANFYTRVIFTKFLVTNGFFNFPLHKIYQGVETVTNT